MGDFDGDGKADALLRRDDGLWYYYPMDGREILDGRGVSNLTRNTEWSVAGIGDLDGDGRDDVLLRKKDNDRHLVLLPDGRRPAPRRFGQGRREPDVGPELGSRRATRRRCSGTARRARR